MKNSNGFKLATLAASIALAMTSTAALAAAPTATQLPGAGKVVLGAGTTSAGAITSGAQTITVGGPTVINWGAGTDINATSQPAGFNIGSGAALTFAGTGGVLNVDVSGNASQIFGQLSSSAGNLYVANANGIIVGATAQISSTAGDVGLIANSLGATSGFDGTIPSVGFNGTSTGAGNVTVTTGATINGTNVLVSGAGTVNVDLSTLTGGAVTLSAGLPNTGGAFAATNANASLAASGALGGGATLASFASAGNASSSGTLALGSNAMVEGTLTNTGTMTLGTGFAIDGAVVNNKTMSQTDSVSAGSFSNSGAYDGGSFQLSTTAGGLTNSGQMTNMGYVSLTGGDFVNNGQFASNGYDIDTYGGNVTNNGKVTGVGYVVISQGGNFTNTGTMSINDGVYVVNGSIANSGQLSVDYYVETASDDTVAGFTKGADYSITNTGTITGSNELALSANSDYWGDHNGTSANNSTGSVINGSTGVLQVGQGNGLQLQAYNDVTLGGTVQVYNGTKYAALSATNALNWLDIYAGDYDGSVLNTTGTATVSTALTTSGGAEIAGNQVSLLSNLSSVDSTGTPTSDISIIAGAQQASDYAVRVGSGVTVSADSIDVSGDVAADNPNVLVNGTLSANSMYFGDGGGAISNLFTGPSGSLVMYNDGANPYLGLNFTGIVKTVPYNNASNFRFNGLAVNVTDGSPLTVVLNPTAYTTNGTSNGLSAVNLLVNSDVILQSDPVATVAAGGTAVTGVTNVPNTHLVVQSSGSITTQGDGINAFYWPGYVYLGNVAANADGSAAPGTLGLGTITTLGDFNNVLPGDIAGASGIHFITQFPMTLGGNVITNANAWVNFGTDLLTQAYASGTLGANAFFGGTQGSGSVVNYGPLASTDFVTQAPSATP